MTWGMRTLGMFNVLFCAFGIVYFSLTALWHWKAWTAHTSMFEWLIFVTLCVICLSLVILVGYLGKRASAGDKAVLKYLAVVFAVELVYVVVDVAVFWLVLPASMDHVVLGFWEASENFLTPQIITGYPLLGIIASLILHFRSRPRLVKSASGD